MIRPRRTLRRNEPSKAEKQAARELCFQRAGGMCQLQLVQECWGFAPLDSYSGDPMTHGHLSHRRNKSVYGWQENDEKGQFHDWSCPPCHITGKHNPKPCPPKH
jgi:hypothetical protein